MNTSVPREAVSVYNQALEFTNRGDFQNAVDEYRKAIDLFPSFVEAYNNIGEAYSQMGMREQAISSYMDALKIEKNSRVLLNLGVEHYNNNNYKKALKFFKESTEIDSEFLEGQFYTGLINYNEMNLVEAEKHFSKVIQIDSQHLKANYMLSYIYYEWKDYNKVITCLDRINDSADDRLFINRYYGFCYYYLGDYAKAIDHLTSALEAKPEYKKFKKYLKGLTYEKKLKEIGNVKKAIEALENEIMNREPEVKDATKLSMLYIFNGENKKAEELILSIKDKLAS